MDLRRTSYEPKSIWGLCCLRSILTSATVAAACTGCAHGRIDVFSIEPNPACKGQTVHISYSTGVGGPSLTTAPPVPGLDFKPHKGDDVLSFAAEQDTTITFSAMGSGSTDTRSIRLLVRDPATPVLLEPTGACPGPTWRQSLLAGQWPENAEVVTVTNLDPVPITVAHQGRSVLLGPRGGASSTSADFGGRPLVGDWNLRPTLPEAICPPGCGVTGGDCPTFPAARVEVAWRCPAR